MLPWRTILLWLVSQKGLRTPCEQVLAHQNVCCCCLDVSLWCWHSATHLSLMLLAVYWQTADQLTGSGCPPAAAPPDCSADRVAQPERLAAARAALPAAAPPAALQELLFQSAAVPPPPAGRRHCQRPGQDPAVPATPPQQWVAAWPPITASLVLQPLVCSSRSLTPQFFINVVK